FGVMFFEDPVLAFSNIRNMLKPGRKFVFAAWADMTDNEWVQAPLRALLEQLDSVPAHHLPLPQAHEPGPFSLANPERTRTVLSSAGWQEIKIHPWMGHLSFDHMQTLDDVVDFMSSVGGAARLVESGLIEAAEARSILAEFLSPIWEEGTATTWRAKAWIVSALTPGIPA
ncbi:MAG: hypothetical protein VYC38_14920, partial [Pseudomonadota bacterium]|nr:hypothetical protein [Pseudomonadota bacterium]